MNESSVTSGAEWRKQTGFICVKLSYVTLWHVYIHRGGNYSCVTKHIFAVYLHLYFFFFNKCLKLVNQVPL